jgi:hypothetical protein
MPKRPTARVNRQLISRIGGLSWTAIEIAGGWAETSERLNSDERAELTRLRTKARNKRTPLTKGEQAKYTSLVVKAVGVKRLAELVNRNPPSTVSPREPRDVDAAERLRRAKQLLDDGVITAEDFEQLKARHLPDL